LCAFEIEDMQSLMQVVDDGTYAKGLGRSARSSRATVLFFPQSGTGNEKTSFNLPLVKADIENLSNFGKL
jgi:hypothetical protein